MEIWKYVVKEDDEISEKTSKQMKYMNNNVDIKEEEEISEKTFKFLGLNKTPHKPKRTECNGAILIPCQKRIQINSKLSSFKLKKYMEKPLPNVILKNCHKSSMKIKDHQYASWLSLNFDAMNHNRKSGYEREKVEEKYLEQKEQEEKQEKLNFFRNYAMCKFCNNLYLGETFKTQLFLLFPKNVIFFCKCPYPIYGKKKTNFINYNFLDYALKEHKTEKLKKAWESERSSRQSMKPEQDIKLKEMFLNDQDFNMLLRNMKTKKQKQGLKKIRKHLKYNEIINTINKTYKKQKKIEATNKNKTTKIKLKKNIVNQISKVQLGIFQNRSIFSEPNIREKLQMGGYIKNKFIKLKYNNKQLQESKNQYQLLDQMHFKSNYYNLKAKNQKKWLINHSNPAIKKLFRYSTQSTQRLTKKTKKKQYSSEQGFKLKIPIQYFSEIKRKEEKQTFKPYYLKQSSSPIRELLEKNPKRNFSLKSILMEDLKTDNLIKNMKTRYVESKKLKYRTASKNFSMRVKKLNMTEGKWKSSKTTQLKMRKTFGSEMLKTPNGLFLSYTQPKAWSTAFQSKTLQLKQKHRFKIQRNKTQPNFNYKTSHKFYQSDVDFSNVISEEKSNDYLNNLFKSIPDMRKTAKM